MASHARVLDPATGCKLKLAKAKRLYEQGVIVWLTEHVTYRKLTLAEIVNRRSQIAKHQEPIPFAEIPGLIYQPAERNLAQTRASYELLAQANRFCLEHA